MRTRVVTLSIFAAAILALLGLAVTLLRPGSPPPETSAESSADAGEAPQPRLPARLRPRSLPRFITAPTSEPAAPLVPPPLAPPPPPPPPDPARARVELRARASKDGFLFREEGSYAIYVVQNGTKFHIQDPQEFRSLGYRPDHIEVVPQGALEFLRDRPQENTMFRERDNPSIYLYENGQKRLITSPEVIDRLGRKREDVKVVPSGSLGGEAIGAPLQ